VPARKLRVRRRPVDLELGYSAAVDDIETDAGRDRRKGGAVVEVRPRAQGAKRHRPIHQPGVEVRQPELGRESARERRLAGSGGTVDRDEHQISAVSRSASNDSRAETKPGNDTSAASARSTSTASSAARPATAMAIAIR